MLNLLGLKSPIYFRINMMIMHHLTHHVHIFCVRWCIWRYRSTHPQSSPNTRTGKWGVNPCGKRGSPSSDQELNIIQLPGLEWVDRDVLGVQSVLTMDERIQFLMKPKNPIKFSLMVWICYSNFVVSILLCGLLNIWQSNTPSTSDNFSKF